MIKKDSQAVVYRVLSCIFAVILIFCMFVNRNVIDIFYMSIISVFILNYIVEIKIK